MTAGRPRSPGAGWSTEDELDFIAGLGTWTGFEPKRKEQLPDLLRGYLAGMYHRENWRHLSYARIKAAVEARLAALAEEGFK